MFNTGDLIRNKMAGNVYRVDEDGLTVVEISHLGQSMIDLAKSLGADVSGIGIGTKYPFSLSNPNDNPDRWEIVTQS